MTLSFFTSFRQDPKNIEFYYCCRAFNYLLRSFFRDKELLSASDAIDEAKFLKIIKERRGDAYDVSNIIDRLRASREANMFCRWCYFRLWEEKEKNIQE